MKMIVALGTALASGFLLASSDGTVKAAWFVKDISCKVGTPLAD